jgi:hypothetical protein
MEQHKTSAQAMATHYQDWKASGLRQVAYSNANGLTFHKFNCWCRKFQQAACHSDTRASGFVLVWVKKPGSASHCFLAITE